MMRAKLSLWFPPLFLMGLIFTLSSFPTLPIPKLPIPLLDKLAHALVYGLLGFLLCRASHLGWKWTWKSAALFAVVVSSSYGIADEWHQSFTPGRFVEAADWIADTVGAALAQIPGYFLYGKQRKF